MNRVKIKLKWLDHRKEYFGSIVNEPYKSRWNMLLFKLSRIPTILLVVTSDHWNNNIIENSTSN